LFTKNEARRIAANIAELRDIHQDMIDARWFTRIPRTLTAI
jgi:hypothetical protein